MKFEIDNLVTVSEYNQLRELVGWEKHSDKQAEICLANSHIIAMRKDNIPVGMARVFSDGACIFTVADVMVNPNYQGKGIGKQLILLADEYIKESLLPNTKARVYLMSLKGKEPFYEKGGFTVLPTEQLGCGCIKTIEKLN